MNDTKQTERRPGRGVMLSTFDSMGVGIPSIASGAARAEELGFDSLWVGDHLFFHRPNVEAIVALSVAAGATEKIGLGTGVLLPALREPVLLAKQITSLQAASGERLLVGIGVGGEFPPEWAAVGIDPAERGSRTDEILEFLTRVFRGDPVNYRSQHYQFRCPPMQPVCAAAPPIWVGGRSGAAIRRAVHFGSGWLSVWASSRRMKDSMALLTETGVRASILVFVSFGSRTAARQQAVEFVAGHYNLPFSSMERYVCLGSAEAVAEQLYPYRQLGLEDFVIYPMAPDPSQGYGEAAAVYEALGM